MKWGILATGVIARKFADTINQMPGESLAAVGSRTLEQAKAFADEYKAGKYYASYEELAADPEVEAIYVSTPNSMHFENCRMCLNAGKHVLCEKPFHHGKLAGGGALQAGGGKGALHHGGLLDPSPAALRKA